MTGPGPMSEVAAAAEHIRAGGVVAFPTETVYGLGADALNARAVARVFELKGRPPHNPLIVHVSGPEMARRVVAAGEMAEGTAAAALAREFWPGPLSIVLPRSADLPPAVTAGGPRVAVRCPDHPLALALLMSCSRPLVGPSANLSGHVSPTSAEHVREAFDGEDVLVLDGGPCAAGIESTVLLLEHDDAVILRPGLIGPEEIERVLGRTVRYREHRADAAEGALPSPGLLESHYAPRAAAVRFAGRDWGPLLESAEGPVVALALSPLNAPYPHAVIAMPTDAAEYARALYVALREADRGAEGGGEGGGASSAPWLIAIEEPPVEGETERDTAIWRAVRDRVWRASMPFRP